MSEHRDGDAIITWLLLVLGVPLWIFWDSALVLSFRFDVKTENIVFEKKPHDCDFLTAPIGLKHCSYEIQYAPSDSGERENRQLYVYYLKESD